MLARKSHAPKAGSSQTKRPKGDPPPELSRRELEQLLFDTARVRAAIARSRSRA
jgi:hypothetical protein